MSFGHWGLHTAAERDDSEDAQWKLHEAHDKDYSWDDGPRVPATGKWYHVSKHDLPVGTKLEPGGGESSWDSWYQSEPNQSPERRAEWVWMEPDLEGADQWTSRHGGDHVYEVKPSHEPLPWNGTGQHGHVAYSATILGKIDPEEVESAWMKKPDHTASTDGIRYAHVVEADVADDLMKLAGQDPYLSDDHRHTARVDAAEQVMTRSALAGKIFHVPGATPAEAKPLGIDAWDLQRHHSAEAEKFVNGLLRDNGFDHQERGWVTVKPHPWAARNMSPNTQAWTDGSHIYLPGEHVNQLSLIHEAAHVLTGTQEGEGHGPDFQKILHGLYHQHLGPEAAKVFGNITGLHDHTAARLAMPAPTPEGITYHHHPTNDTIPTEPWAGSPESTVMVNKFSAPAVEARHNGETVGYLEYSPSLSAQNVNGMEYGDHPPEIGMIKVRRGYQRHGIGTGMLDFARQHEPDLQHSDARTGLGDKWMAYEQSRTAMPNPLPQGVHFRYHPELMWSPGVTAHHKGKQIGSLEWYDDDHVMVDLGSRKPGEIDRISVHPDHQGNSVASSMFDFAKQHEPRLHHSEQLTEDGRGWSEYEKARNARLAMAWDEWAPHIEHKPDETGGVYTIDHPASPHRKDRRYSDLTYGLDSEKAYIGLLYVDEDFRNNGVAESLIRRLHEDHPNHKIVPGSMSESGQGFHDKMLNKEPDARGLLTTAGRNGEPPPMTFEPFNTMWSNGIMARHAEDGRPIAHLHWHPDGEIESIRTHPELQGRDIAKHVLAHAATHPETYEARHGIKPSNHMTNAGRAFARSLGHNPPDEEVEPADDDAANWGWTAVDNYTPMHVPYTGQNEDEMSHHLDKPWTPPEKTAAAHDDGWPVWWRTRPHPAGPWDKRWHPNHPEHTPAPWDN